MKPFIFQWGPQPWPPGLTALQLYALVNLRTQDKLAALVAGCRDAMAGYPVTVVEDQWLHVTLEQITDQPATGIPAAERRQLVSALRAKLTGFAPFQIIAGSPIANRAGTLLDLHPDGRLEHLHRLIRAAVHEVRGPGSTDYGVLPCHLTLAYATTEIDSDLLQSPLRRVRPSHAPLGIEAVHLVEVSPDQQGKQLRWAEITEIPLARRPASGHPAAADTLDTRARRPRQHPANREAP